MNAQLSAVGAVAVLLVAAVAAVVSLPLAFAVVVLFLATAAASAWTSAALTGAGIVVALVPIYWVPDIPGTRVSVPPMVVACIALAPVALRLRPQLRWGLTDRLVGLYVLVVAVSYTLNTSGSLGSITATVLGVAVPYATFRLLAFRPEASSQVAVGLVVGGVVSAWIAVREYRGWPNPFFEYFRSGHQHAFFARADERLGHVRPEAAFGHAIALGMFFVLAAVLAIGLAWSARRAPRTPRVLLYASVAAIVFALLNTLVRGPLIMIGFAVIVLVARESRRGQIGRGVAIAIAAVVLVNVPAFSNVLQLRDATFESGGRVQRSGEYRFEIWRVITDPANFSLLGDAVVDEDGLGFTKAAGHAVGLKSFDNAYALIYIGWGVLALAAFVLIALRVAQAALFSPLPIIDQAWAASLLAALVNLMTVNLLTQFAHLFWAGLGLIVTAHQLATQRAEQADAAIAEPISA